MNIQPGKTVTVTIKSTLKTSQAQKTLARLFLKDPIVSNNRLQEAKPVRYKNRGGRDDWSHRSRGSALIIPKVGECAKIRATVDVIRDLQSVEKYINVK